ncbi:hypothetical protein MPH47_11680 [Psychrobacillus psychrodurans]|nr:hypothetical protein [Psychrobacillus psychrodurans]MCK1997880.1 hypothetical protein [Psychrobacillus psychrodurans]
MISWLRSFSTYAKMTKRQALTYPKLTKILMITAERFGWGNFINGAVKAF